jgi:hypothetical protein
VWQEVHEELEGLEIVTVAMDVGGVDAAAKWIDAANPSHPALIDEEHRLGALLGIVNVPSGVWIDEDGVIVRPPGPAWPGRAVFRENLVGLELPDDVDPYVVEALEVTAQLEVHPERYLDAVRDWVANGADSAFAMTPDVVLAASRPRPAEHSLAAAHFELGQHLWRDGSPEAATRHFAAAHRLQPDNWTYKRQAWNFVSPVLQDAREVYGTSWAREVAAAGPENYYPGQL